MIGYAVYREFWVFLINFSKSCKCHIYACEVCFSIKVKMLLSIMLIFPNFAYSSDSLTIPMDLSHWKYKGSNFECNLMHSSSLVGKFYFRSKTKESLSFISEVKYKNNKWLNATLSSVNAPWMQAELSTLVSSFTAQRPTKRFEFRDEVKVLLDAVGNGWWIMLSLGGSNASALSEVKIPTIQIKKALSAFNACRERLPKLSFSQARDIVMPFKFGQKVLSRHQQNKLDALYSYVSVDNRVKKILIDGHADKVGSNLANLSVSRKRAQQVADALIARGIRSDMLEVRAHGSRYPVASNNTAKGQAKNRRVTIRLVRDDERVIAEKGTHLEQNQQKKVKVQ